MSQQTSSAPATAPQRSLQGRSAIVTGSTSGIGLGVATALAARGAKVVLNGLETADQVEEIRANLSREHDTEVAFAGADLSKPENVVAMVEQARAAVGPIDILVNNAGIQFVSPVEDFPTEKWDAILSINLSAAFHGIKANFAQMKDRGWGRVVNIASAHGLVASPYKAAYVAAKHGVVGLTKVVALEGAEAGVTCNAICPGYVWTPLVEQQIEDQARAHKISRDDVIRDVLLKNQPNKKFATVEEIGAATAFLCSNEAQSITGTAMPVDGGWTAH
ncbi:MAG: 3-hydroxybutyrate dehydrogenase [Pseudomonadota bacterium]